MTEEWHPVIPYNLSRYMHQKLDMVSLGAMEASAEIERAWDVFVPKMTAEDIFMRHYFTVRVTRRGSRLTLAIGGDQRYEFDYYETMPAAKLQELLAPHVPADWTIRMEQSTTLLRVLDTSTRKAQFLRSELSIYDHMTADGGREYVLGYGMSIGDLSGRVRRLLRLEETMRQEARIAMLARRENPPLGELPRHDRKMHEQKKSTAERFIAWIDARNETLREDESILNTLPLADHGTLSSRRWGIEVELAGARGVGTPTDWECKDDGSLRPAYTEPPEGFVSYIDPLDCQYNSHALTIEGRTNTIPNPGYTDPARCYYCGDIDYDEDGQVGDTAEFVSPILRSFHSRGLASILEQASTQPQNDTAGVHVHVEAKDLTPRQVGNLVYAYTLMEPLLEASYRRGDEREYCRRYSAQGLMEVRSALYASKAEKAAQIDVYAIADERYKTINIQALRAHGTIEFRGMASVDKYDFDYNYLIRWAHFCREMVNLAKADVALKEWGRVKTFADLRVLFAKYGKETSKIALDALDFTASTDDDIHIVTDHAGLVEI